MSGPFAPPLPLRILLALIVLVLCAHGLLLSGSTRAWSPGQRTSTAMTIRSMVAEPAAAAPVAAPQAALPVKPPRAKKTPAQPRNSQENMPVVPVSRTQAAIENIATILLLEDKTPATPAPESVLPPPITESPTQVATPVPQPAPVPPAPNEVSLATSAQHEVSPIAAAPAVARADPAQTLELKFPPSGRFDYVATLLRGVQPQTGSGSLEWTSDGRAYAMRLSSSAFFVTLLSQTSVGQLGADGLMPERFADKRVNRSEKATHFARNTASGAGRISFSGNQSAMALQRGAQDRLSVLMQLAGLAAANPVQFTGVGKFAIQVASTEGADIWQLVVEGEETLQLPAGSTRALHVVRNPRQEYDARLELWLAPELGYLPVRIKQTEANGNTSDLQLRSPPLP
ncbi:MAG: DUF3108 domain-containing protein [Burkholderiaceae bacterium]